MSRRGLKWQACGCGDDGRQRVVGVPDAHEAEPLGGGALSGEPAVSGVENVAHALGFDAFSAEVQEGSDDVSDHVVDEAVSEDVDVEFVGPDGACERVGGRLEGSDPDEAYVPSAVDAAVARGGEAGEIVVSDEFGGGGLHDG